MLALAALALAAASSLIAGGEPINFWLLREGSSASAAGA